MKKLYIYMMIFMFSSIQVLAQADNITVTVSEDQLNEAITTRLTEANRDIEMTVDLEIGQVTVQSRMSSTEQDMGIMFETIYIGDISEGRLTWTATNWEAITTDGEVFEPNDFPRRAFAASNELWQGALRQLIRQEIGAQQGVTVNSLNITDDGMVIELTLTDERPAPDRLPSNVELNEDGTVSLIVSEDHLNTALENVTNRRPSLDYLIITMENLMITFNLQIEPICEASIIVDFQVVASLPVMDINPTENSIFASDLNDDGMTDLGILTTNLDASSPILTGIMFETARCGDTPLTAQQRVQINTLLLPAVQRLLQLQTCGANIYGVEFGVGDLTFLLDESYTTCRTTHL